MKPPKKSKYGDYESVVSFPPFANYYVHIVFAKDIAEAKKARYGEASKKEVNALALHVRGLNGHGHLIFELSSDTTAGTVAHECWHAIRHMLLEWVGVDSLDNEIVAYLLGYLVEQVHKFKSKVEAL